MRPVLPADRSGLRKRTPANVSEHQRTTAQLSVVDVRWRSLAFVVESSRCWDFGLKVEISYLISVEFLGPRFIASSLFLIDYNHSSCDGTNHVLLCSTNKRLEQTV